MYMDASTQHIPTSLLLLHLFSHNLWYQLEIIQDRRWLVWHWHCITTSQAPTHNTPFVTPPSSPLPASSWQPPCSPLLLLDAHVPWLWYGQICMRYSMGKWEENTITSSNGTVHLIKTFTFYARRTSTITGVLRVWIRALRRKYCQTVVKTRWWCTIKQQQLVSWKYIHVYVHTYIMYPLSHMEPPFLMVLLIWSI